MRDSELIINHLARIVEKYRDAIIAADPEMAIVIQDALEVARGNIEPPNMTIYELR